MTWAVPSPSFSFFLAPPISRMRFLTKDSADNFSWLMSTPDSDLSLALKSIHYTKLLAAASNWSSIKN